MEVSNFLRVRSSHQRCSVRKGLLRNFTKFTGKHLCQSLFFNKVAGLRPVNLAMESGFRPSVHHYGLSSNDSCP